MRVLIAYATRHGSTQGIAERIALTIREAGLDAIALPVRRAGDVRGYDAFVIGSAAYMFHWLGEATSFVRRNRRILAERPVWLFSSGPIGTDLVDAKGRDVFVASEPREFAELSPAIRPKEARVFFGAYDPNAKPVGFAERFTRSMPATRNLLPAGDFRDWPSIDAWARSIAEALSTASVSAPA